MKRITKELEKEFTKAKQYVYSWLTDGEGDTTYAISDKLSNLNIDFGANLTAAAEAGIPVPATPEAVNFVHGNTKNSYAKTIAAGYLQVEKKVAGEQDLDKEYTFSAPKSLNVVGVDAGNIYGGVVITTNCKCTSINYSSASRYENVNGIVAGDRDILIEDVKAKGVYGGGAGYGSVLDGNVSISLVGTNNSITNVFGGGQKGAVVTGDVSIDVSRRDAKGGKIGTIYGGGEDAIVKGDVTITIHGTNAVGIGTVSGSGKGKKSEVMGDRYLIIDGFSGKFTTTIKDFDHITLTSGTAITLTQSQQKSIQSATYEFVVDDATLKQTNAMLTWNKNINVGQIYITLDSDFASNVTDVFQTAIFSSTYLTQQTYEVWNQGLQIRDEDGNVVKGYTTEFVADVDSKGKAKKKGGTIVLKFEGTNADITDEDVGKREFSAANDDVNIRGEYVAASVATMGGDDTVTVQKNTVMAGNIDTGTGNDAVNVQTGAIVTGDIALGEGENALRVLGDGEVVGSIIVDKNSKNVIDVNGTISQIEGGDSTTENIVTLRKKNAVGYYEYNNGILGKNGAFDIGLAGEVLSGEIKFGEYRGDFIKQDLDFTNSDGSNDTVLVTQASEWDGNINFGKGKDTLVLNTPATANGPASHGTITAEDGDDVIVANQTGVTVDADKLKLSGTDNILVVSNGVKATIKGMAIGDFETDYGKFSGLFLGQNAILDDGAGNYAVESFAGNMTLKGDLTVLSPKDYTNPESDNYSQELADRIGTYYTVGNGVNGVINANGKKINLNKGATVSGEIYGLNGKMITLLEGSAINGTVVGNSDIYFKQNAGSEDFLFELEKGEKATIRVAKNVIATVGSINGIDGTTFEGTDDFEKDSAHVTLNEDAALYAAQDKNLLVGNITKDTDFAEKYGDMAKGTISVIGPVNGRVTFTDAKAYFGNKAAFHKGITFKGANTVDVQSAKIVIDDKQLFFDGDDAKVDFNVLDGAELVFDGIEKGGKISDKVSINLAKNARLAYGDNMETGSWSDEFNANKLDGRSNITFRENSLVDNKINLADANAVTVNVEKGSFVKGDLTVEDKGVVTLGKGEDTLNVNEARVDGVINAANDAAGNKDIVNLTGSTVNGVKVLGGMDEIAVKLNGKDELFAKDGALVNGDITGGALVHITDSEVTGSIEAAKNVLIGATVDTIKNGDTFVESGKDASGTESTIGLVDATKNNVSVFADDAKATIGAFEGTTGNTIHLEARNKGTVALSNVDTTVGDVEFRAFHDGSAVDFGGDVKLVADNATFTAEEGGELKNLGNVEVSGGFTGNIKTLAGTTAAAQTATLASVNGKAITAGDVTFVADDSAINLESEGTFNTLGAIAQSGALTKDGYGRVTDAAAANTAAITLGEKTFLSAKSVDQVAADADVAIGGNGGLTVEGDIAQKKFATAGIWAGAVADDGTPLDGALSVGGNIVQESEEANAFALVGTMGTLEVKGADGIVQTAKGGAVMAGFGENSVAGGIAQNTDATATVALVGESKVGAITQNAANEADAGFVGTTNIAGAVAQVANTAKVTVEGDATVAGGIVQKNVDATGKDIAAATAEVNVAGTLAGDVTQLAGASLVKFDNEAEIASVGAVTQSGGATARVMGKADVTQAYTTETFSEALEDKNIDALERTVGAVSQEADENAVKLDATVFADGEYDGANHHKAAKINIGSVTLKAGDIEQVGDKNVVTANVAYTAQGESDVTIGATAIELGTITQTSDEGNRNVVEITAAQTMGAENQSVMTLGDITGKVGAISQKAYKAINKVDLDVATAEDDNLTVGNAKLDVEGGISMLAYGDGAKNNLNLAGSVNVAGDVKVGGVIDGENISEDSVWGDRTAERNLVNVTADTVKINGNLSLVGLTNKLTLENDSYFKGDTETKNPVAKDIALAGKKNAVDIAAGVKVDNIALYDLIDHDGIGVEGYDLTTDGNYTNEITLRGEAAGLVLNKQLRANDTINVYGGKIEGGLVTGNGDDAINLGNDGKLLEGADGTMAARVMGDATIGGDVSMGKAGEADGSNTITMQAFAARDLANPDADVAHNVAIGGKVDMYAGKNSKTGAAAANTLSLAGTGVYNADTGLTTVGTASIDGAVTMVAENAYDANGVLDEGTNTINMGPLTKIDGPVTMTAYQANTINVLASEEIIKEADVNAYAEIAGKVAMTGKENVINVSGAAGSDTAAKGAAAYMDGISMANKYADQDGKEYIIQNATNTITVGDDDNMIGSELIVGKSVSEKADVAMGTIAFQKPNSQAVNWDLVSVEKAAKGHDVLTYLGEMDAVVTDLTAQNRIDVVGRFDANDVTMMAKNNYITVTGDGNLGKGGALASEDVRTASFTANTVTQIAGLSTENSIIAEGTGSLLHYGYALDAATGEYDDNLSGIAELPSVRFTTGDINQLQYGTVEGGQTAADNTVSLTGFIIAKTGDITQQGEGDNAVTVRAYEARTVGTAETLEDMGLAVERSTVGAITQGSEALLGKTNDVDLNRTDAGDIAQFAANDNTVAMDKSTSGKIAQTAGNDNTVTLNDSTSGDITETAGNVNDVSLTGSTSGKITQTANLHNTVYAESLNGFSQDALTDEEKEAGEVEGKINFQQSNIDGDIVQTSNKLVGETDSETYGNMVEAYDTNITGAITQTGATENSVEVQGRVEGVTFLNDNGVDETTYQQAYNVAVGGNIVQNDAYLNEVRLTDAAAGAITQTGTANNVVELASDTVAAATNTGKLPEGETDENCSLGDGNTHIPETIKSQADFNRQTVGDIVQTAGVADADELDALQTAGVYTAENEINADNMTLANVTQTHAEGTNTLNVNQAVADPGKLTKLGEYAGEVSEALAPISKVEEYEVYEATTVGNVVQTGTANTATMTSVAAGTVTQTTQAATFDTTVQIGNNELYTTAVTDAQKVFVDQAAWDGTVPGEIFTPTLLEGSDNVRAANTLGAITQVNAAADNYDNQVENIVSLANTTVNGAVSQTGAVNGNVRNDFTAATVAQQLTDAYTDDAGEVQVVPGYAQTTLDDITGAFTQEGFDNTATLTNVNIAGDVTQTVNMISTVAGHGSLLAGENAGDNYFEVNGSKDAKVDGILDETVNVVDVAQGGTISQIANNAGDVTYVADLVSDNTIIAQKANLAEGGVIEQTTTYGTNSIDIYSDNVADKPNTLLKAGDITQTGSTNSINAETTAMGTVEQTANAQEGKAADITNAVTLTGSVVSYAITEGTGTLADPEVMIQQPMAEYASAELIDQTVNQLADETLVEGKALYDVANDTGIYENYISAEFANVVEVRQGGEGMIDNSVEFIGNARDVYEFVVDEAFDSAQWLVVNPPVKDNTLGNVTQTGVTNYASIQTAASVGEIVQTADSVDTVETTETTPDVLQTVSKVLDISNYLEIGDADTVGTITQTATSDTFTTEYYKNGEVNADVDPVDGGIVTASNYAEIDSANVGNVTQTIDGTAGVGGNTIDAEDANLGNVEQTTVIGNNTVWSYTDSSAAEAESKTIGTIDQTGNTNYVGTGDVETGAITQTANGVEANDAISNSVEMTGVPLDAFATLKEGEDPTQLASYDFTPATIAAAKAESIWQEANAVAEQDDMFNAAMTAINTVILQTADVGDVTQSGNANTTNSLTFTGAEVPAMKISTTTVDDVTTVDYPLTTVVDTEGESTYPNMIGAVTQTGVYNSAEITNGALDGDVTQTAVSNGTIETTYDDPTDPTEKYVMTSQADVNGNSLTLNNVATTGTIIQTAMSDVITTSRTTYVKDGEDWVLKEVVEPDTNPEVWVADDYVYNYAEIDNAQVGDITQTIDGTAQLGDNTIEADNSNLGIVIQTTTNGTNTLYAWTNSTNTDELSRIVGTIDQTGVNNDVQTDDVHTGAITQNANGVTTVDALSNSVTMTGIVIDPAAEASPIEGADPSKKESYEFVPNGHVADTKADSITQTATVEVVETLEDSDGNPVDYFDGNAQASNTIELYTADAGAIIQEGNANTTNTVIFEGATVEVKTVTEVTPDPLEGETYAHETEYDPDYILTDESTVVKANTLGTVDQTGVSNGAEIRVALEAGDITQTAVATKKIATQDGDLDMVFGDGAMGMDADTAALAFGEENKKYFYSDEVKADPFTKVETTQSKTISNTLTLEDVGTVGSIEQTALGEEFLEETKYSWWHGGEDNPNAPYPQENLTKTTKAYTDGTNKVTIQLSEDGKGTTVAGKITQTAAGGYGKIDDEVYQNHVKATGSYTVSAEVLPEGEADSSNPKTIKDGEYLNSIADVEQTLTSYATSFAYNAETNFIELSQINAGALKQVANGYAANLIDVNQGGGLVQKLKVEDDGITITPTGKIPTTIASIEQEGLYNTLRLVDVKIGAVQEDETFKTADITVNAKGIFTESEDGENWEFGKNSVSLTNVEVNDLLVKTQEGTVTIDGKQYVNAAANAEVTLDAVTAHDVKTEEGNDTLTLTGTTTITGTIDMGDNTWTITPKDPLDLTKGYDMLPGKDELTIDASFTGDLSAATIKNVEVITVESGITELYAKNIQAGNITFDDVSTEWYTPGPNTIKAESIELGTLTNVHYINSVDDETAIKVTLKDGNNTLQIKGASGSALDTMVVGDGVGTGVILENTDLYDFDLVEFKSGAEAANNQMAYSRLVDTDDTNNGITFKFTLADGDNDFVIGNFADGPTTGSTAYEGYANSDVTFNVNGTDFGWNATESKWLADGSNKYYTYDQGSGTVIQGTIA